MGLSALCAQTSVVYDTVLCSSLPPAPATSAAILGQGKWRLVVHKSFDGLSLRLMPCSYWIAATGDGLGPWLMHWRARRPLRN